jgi:hypothetical protein
MGQGRGKNAGRANEQNQKANIDCAHDHSPSAQAEGQFMGDVGASALILVKFRKGSPIRGEDP